MKRVFIPPLIGILILIAFAFRTAKADDDCLSCAGSDAACVDCCSKPEPPQYIVGQFDIEESDRYDQALANWQSYCGGSSERCVNCSVEVGSVAPRDQSEARVESPMSDED